MEDPIYLRMLHALSDKSDPATILCEYTATKWLEVIRSDYRDVVAGELQLLKAELCAQGSTDPGSVRRAHGLGQRQE